MFDGDGGGGGDVGNKTQDSVTLLWFKGLPSPTSSLLKRPALDGRRVESGSRRTEGNIQHSSRSPQCEKVLWMRNQEF